MGISQHMSIFPTSAQMVVKSGMEVGTDGAILKSGCWFSEWNMIYWKTYESRSRGQRRQGRRHHSKEVSQSLMSRCLLDGLLLWRAWPKRWRRGRRRWWMKFSYLRFWVGNTKKYKIVVDCSVGWLLKLCDCWWGWGDLRGNLWSSYRFLVLLSMRVSS
jgi:hypothetical protein